MDQRRQDRAPLDWTRLDSTRLDWMGLECVWLGLVSKSRPPFACQAQLQRPLKRKRARTSDNGRPSGNL